MGALCDALPEPVAAFTNLACQLDSIKRDALTGLQTLRSQRDASKTFGVSSTSVPSLAGFLTAGPASVLPQATWIVDKLSSALPGFAAAGPAVPAITGLEDSLLSLAQKVSSVSAGFAGSMTAALGNAFDSWLSDPSNFLSSTGDAVIDAVSASVTTIFDALETVLEAAGSLLSLLKGAPGELIKWFDRPFPDSYSTGLYYGLTDRDMSIFDVVCLAAAIPAVLRTGSRSSDMSMAAMTEMTDLEIASLSFLAAQAVFGGISAGTTAVQSNEGTIKNLDSITTGLSICCLVAAESCFLWEAESELTAIVGTFAIGYVVELGAIFLVAPGTEPYRESVLRYGLSIYALANLGYLGYTLLKDPP